MPHRLSVSGLVCLSLSLSFSASAIDWYWVNDFGGIWDEGTPGFPNWKDSKDAGGVPDAGDNAYMVLPYSLGLPQPIEIQYRSDTNPVLNQIIIESQNVLYQREQPFITVDQLHLTSNVEIIGGAGPESMYTPPPSYFLPPSPWLVPVGAHIQSAGTNTVNLELRIGGVSGSQGTYELSGDVLTELTVVGIENVGVDGNGQFTQTGGTHTVKDLNLGVVTGTGNYSMSAGVLTVTRDLNLGLEQGAGNFNMGDGVMTVAGNVGIGIGDGVSGHGNGVFVQTGGQHTIDGTLQLGINTGSTGRYELRNDAVLETLGGVTVGIDGTATIEQTGGTHRIGSGLSTLPTDLVLGTGTGVGNYNLDDSLFTTGELQVFGNVYVGHDGIGTFTQNGGRHVITPAGAGLTGELVIGTNGSSTGFYALDNDGYLEAGTIRISQNGDGLFHQLGSDTLTVVNDRLIVGDFAQGDYTLSGGTLRVHGDTTLGNFARGVMLQGSATATFNGNLVLGGGARGGGDYNLLSSSSQVTVNGTETIGGVGKGEFNHAAGDHHVNGELVLAQSLELVAGEAIESGTYNLIATDTAQQLIVSGNETVGFGGIATFNQSGGAHHVTGNLVLADQAGSQGTYLLSGGVLGVDGAVTVSRFAGDDDAGIADARRGRFVQSGGSHTAGSLTLGRESGSFGEYELSNGTLLVGSESIGRDGGAGLFRQTGGSHTVSNVLNVSAKSTGGSEFIIEGGDLTVGGSGFLPGITLGLPSGANSRARFTQEAGSTVHVDGSIWMATEQGGDGIYTLCSTGCASTDASLTVTGDIILANNDPIATGTDFEDADFVQNGGTVTVTGNVDIYSQGRYTLEEGAVLIANDLRTIADPGDDFWRGRFDHRGELVETRGSTFTNDGDTLFAGTGTRRVVGHVVNNGNMDAVGTTVDFDGVVDNNGRYVSDASTSIFQQLNVGIDGYLVGDAASQFIIEGDFINNSLQNIQWDTDIASLTMNSGASQDMYLAGMDMGALFSAYDDNFSWGELHIAAGTTLNLFDGNATPGAGLYVGLFDLADGVDLNTLLIASIFSDYNIYYDPRLAGNDYLGGMTFALNGAGFLTPSTIPVPPAVYLFGSGIVGLIAVARRRKQTSKGYTP